MAHKRLCPILKRNQRPPSKKRPGPREKTPLPPKNPSPPRLLQNPKKRYSEITSRLGRIYRALPHSEIHPTAPCWQYSEAKISGLVTCIYRLSHLTFFWFTLQLTYERERERERDYRQIIIINFNKIWAYLSTDKQCWHCLLLLICRLLNHVKHWASAVENARIQCMETIDPFGKYYNASNCTC